MNDQKMKIEERAEKYLAAVPGAVEGSGGHNAAFRAACVLMVDFDLDRAAGARLLGQWNLKCSPPWSPKELDHKLDQAEKQRGIDAAKVGCKAKDIKGGKGAAGGGNRNGGGGPTSARARLHFAHDSRDAAPASAAERHALPGVAARPELDISEDFEDFDAPISTAEKAISTDQEDASTPEKATSEAFERDPWANFRRAFGARKSFRDARIRAERAWMKGRDAMPDTLWLDAEVVPELPKSIDRMTVRPWQGAGFIGFSHGGDSPELPESANENGKDGKA